jgi:hypothetical protein
MGIKSGPGLLAGQVVSLQEEIELIKLLQIQVNFFIVHAKPSSYAQVMSNLSFGIARRLAQGFI